MLYRIKAPNPSVYDRVLEMLATRFHAAPQVTSRQRLTMSVADLPPAAISQLESLDAVVSTDFRYDAEVG